MATKKKSIGVIIGAIIGLLAVTAAAIGIATAVRQNTCKHVWNDGEVKVEATCAKEGKLVFKCEECGKYETEAIEKLAHTWTYVEAKMPTCTENGHTEYTACELCDEYKNGVEPQILLAEGHTEIELEGKAPTCTESGLTAGKYCTTCETITVEQRSLKAKGHTIVTLEAKAPTCEMTGLTAGYACSRCDKTYTAQNVVPKLPHVDKDGDNYCENCYNLVFSEVGYNRVAVEEGDKVAGYWYAVEVDALTATSAALKLSAFATDDNKTGYIGVCHVAPSSVSEEYQNKYGIAANGTILTFNNYGSNMFVSNGGYSSGISIIVLDEDFVKLEDGVYYTAGNKTSLTVYFYIPEGEFTFNLNGNNESVVIDDETTVTGIQGEVYRLEEKIS